MSEFIPSELRQFVFQRANGRCEYCHIHQDSSCWRSTPQIASYGEKRCWPKAYTHKLNGRESSSGMET